MDTSDAERRVDDETIAKPFDQTNGMMPDAEGDSDGTAASDTASSAERADDRRDVTNEDLTEGDRGAAAVAAMSVKRTG
ncbi:MAG TPA: hypothetical protein VGO26_06665 [Amnibacterium sp.]|jgi:hypothetical protein|nr:hypothetical protein [Amnibacterium sp.]